MLEKGIDNKITNVFLDLTNVQGNMKWNIGTYYENQINITLDPILDLGNSTQVALMAYSRSIITWDKWCIDGSLFGSRNLGPFRCICSSLFFTLGVHPILCRKCRKLHVWQI